MHGKNGMAKIDAKEVCRLNEWVRWEQKAYRESEARHYACAAVFAGHAQALISEIVRGQRVGTYRW